MIAACFHTLPVGEPFYFRGLINPRNLVVTTASNTLFFILKVFIHNVIFDVLATLAPTIQSAAATPNSKKIGFLRI